MPLLLWWRIHKSSYLNYTVCAGAAGVTRALSLPSLCLVWSAQLHCLARVCYFNHLAGRLRASVVTSAWLPDVHFCQSLCGGFGRLRWATQTRQNRPGVSGSDSLFLDANVWAALNAPDVQAQRGHVIVFWRTPIKTGCWRVSESRWGWEECD